MQPKLSFIFFLILWFLCILIPAQENQALNQAHALIYSNPEKSIQLAEKIYAESKEAPKVQLSALIILGVAYSEKFEVEKSIEHLQQAQKMAEEQEDYINQIRILSLLGYQYQILQINDKAHDYLDRAETIMEQRPLPDSLLYLRGNNYSIKSLAYKESLDCDYAVEYFNKAIDVYKKLSESEMGQTNLCIAYLNKSSCFLENRNLDSAWSSLQKTNQLLKKINVADDITVSQNAALGKYYYLIR